VDYPGCGRRATAPNGAAPGRDADFFHRAAADGLADAEKPGPGIALAAVQLEGHLPGDVPIGCQRSRILFSI